MRGRSKGIGSFRFDEGGSCWDWVVDAAFAVVDVDFALSLDGVVDMLLLFFEYLDMP